MGLTRYGNRSIKDPAVAEDVEFLMALNVPIEEIAKRCNVGIAALDKKYPSIRRSRVI